MRIALALAIAALLPGAARAGPGAVDWQRKVVTCTGSGAANLRDAGGNPAVARIGAEKAAKLDALRNCLEAVKGVTVGSGKTAGDAMASDAAVRARVEGTVRGFQVVGKPRYYSDGGVEMDVEVPLEGAISEALLPAGAGAAPAGKGPAPGTSLVVDARGQKVVPALAPRVLDPAGREIYGPAMLGAPARPGGGAAYARDLESARRDLGARLGDRPLVVKAVRAEGADLVLSDADAAALAGKDLGFLAEGRVVVLTD